MFVEFVVEIDYGVRCVYGCGRRWGLDVVVVSGAVVAVAVT